VDRGTGRAGLLYRALRPIVDEAWTLGVSNDEALRAFGVAAPRGGSPRRSRRCAPGRRTDPTDGPARTGLRPLAPAGVGRGG
jgi:hypothetical protein